MAIDKSGWNKKIKVSQSTIDDIKKMGMTKALKLAGQNSKAAQGGLVKEYQEATRRLYGEKRFAAATGKSSTSAPKYTSPDAARAANKPAKYKSPDAARSAASKPAVKPAASKTVKATDSRPGASGSTSKFKTSSVNGPRKGGISGGTVAKAALGTAAAGAVLLATRGRGAGVAAKLAPGLMRSGVARAALTGTAKAANKVGSKATSAAVKTGDKVASTTGRLAAKTGRAVSQTQYDAMKAAAKAKGIKAPTADAARKAATKKLAKRTAGTAAGAGVTKRK